MNTFETFGQRASRLAQKLLSDDLGYDVLSAVERALGVPCQPNHLTGEEAQPKTVQSDAQAEQYRHDLEVASAELTDLRTFRDEAVKEIADLKGQVVDRDTVIANLRASLDEYAAKLTAANSEIARLTAPPVPAAVTTDAGNGDPGAGEPQPAPNPAA